MELLAIVIVIVGGVGFLAVRRHWLASRDADLTASAGGWRIRSELPHDAGFPYSDFGTDLFLLGPSDVMEGTEEGFEVSYFTIAEDGPRGRRRHQSPAAIVQVPVETPKFRYLAEDLDDDARKQLAAIQHHTPPHYDTGRPGRVGPKTAELLKFAQSVIVETSPFTVFIRSRGARSEDVSRLTIALAKALVADAEARGVAQSSSQ